MKNHVFLNAQRSLRLVVLLILTLGFSSVALAEQPEETWVTMGRDFFDALVKTRGVVSTAMPPKAIASEGDVVLTRIKTRDLMSLSEFGHDRFHRCSGYIAHKTEADGREAMRGANNLFTKIAPSDFTISHQSTVNGLLPNLNKTNILNTIDHLSNNYTNRYYQYASGQQSALWIRDLWAGYAGSRSDVTVQTYTHSFTQPSVIMTIQGNSLASEIVVLGGHLDSIRSGGMSTSTVAPGADDNASGIATISEVIRVLMADGWVPDRTIKFMGYAAEEVGLVGSGEIAADAQSAGDDVVAVMQLDMTNYNGSVEDISFISDNTNADLTTFTQSLVDEYQPSITYSSSACGYGCSDHASWHNRGYPAVMPFEARMGQHNNQIHTSNDTLSFLGNNADHALKFAKLGLSFVIETGLADGPQCTVNADCDDGLFCNGAETCNAGVCQAGSTPCPGQGCDEQNDVCTAGCLHDTDFESGANGWTTGNDSCTTGSFTVGTPDATTWQVGGGNPGQAFYTQPNPGGIGSADVDGGTCEALSPLVNANGASAVDISFDYFHGQRDAGDDSADGFTVEILNNGTVVDTVVSIGDVTTNPAWTNATTTINNPGNIQIRVRASDAPNGGDIVEGGIDNVSICPASGPPPGCSVNADCDDGLFCNGAETCNAGTCQAGTAPSCDDGISCTADSCNESTDSCDNVTNDSLCDNGLWCDGAETCSASLGCQSGTAPSCTNGCDEANDVCFPTGGGCTVDDDFEGGAPNWNNDPASTCTTGDYVTGNPTNPSGGYQIVGSHSGTTSIYTANNSTAGNADVDGGNCILTSPTWSVGNTSTLSVWYWHGQRDQGDDASGDFFRLEYSTNGGSSWNTLASNGDTTSNPSWAEATASIPGGSNVQIRVQCSDGAGPGDLVECGIDDVSICE